MLRGRWKCERKHDAMGEKNLRWAIDAEIVRRRGHRSRPVRIAHEIVDGVVGKLRDRNQRLRGEQPLIRPKDWRVKATGSVTGATSGGDCQGRIHPDWEVAHRELVWPFGPPVGTAKRTSLALETSSGYRGVGGPPNLP